MHVLEVSYIVKYLDVSMSAAMCSDCCYICVNFCLILTIVSCIDRESEVYEFKKVNL